MVFFTLFEEPSGSFLMLYELAYKNVLYNRDPMKTHRLGIDVLEKMGRIKLAQRSVKQFYDFNDPSLETSFLGKKLKNPIGIAGGLDKTGKAVQGLSCFGPGWVEVGTTTYRQWGGNERQHIIRYPGGLINYLGFPNPGHEEVVKNLRSRPKSDTLIAVNIGVTPSAINYNMAENELSNLTYHIIKEFSDNGDAEKIIYIVLNPWCPNTHGIQFRSPEYICRAIRAANKGQLKAREEGLRRMNTLVKIGPDLEYEDLNVILDKIVQSGGIDGIIATNTTISRKGLPAGYSDIEGGLSGRLLEDRATEVIAYIHNRVPKLPIVGVGGIATPNGALEKLQAGASVIQVLTGFIENPGLIKKVKVRLAKDRK